jgi:alkylhydroperoxidase/carboxymuconolactone decarboxylase family protein YurZ
LALNLLEDAMSDTLYDRGMEVRRHLMGPEQSDRQLADVTDFDRPFQDFATRYCFGEVWGNAELSPKIRSLLTVAIVAALGRTGALRTHVRGALLNGATPEEVRGAIMQIAVYCGLPAAVEVNLAARDVLKDTGLE